jgi:hypothetical protein
MNFYELLSTSNLIFGAISAQDLDGTENLNFNSPGGLLLILIS